VRELTHTQCRNAYEWAVVDEEGRADCAIFGGAVGGVTASDEVLQYFLGYRVWM